MAAADVPKWGFGQEPMEIKPVANFISFFSTCDTTLPTENKMSLDFSFSTPSLTRQPAWERVSTQSHPATGKNRRIMKRVGLPTERRVAAKHSPLLTPPVAVVPAPTREDIALDHLAQRKVRRGTNFVPAIGFTDYSGKPSSHAKCLSSMMQAKADVANNFMITSSCTTYHDKVAASRGILQVTPRKRRADSDDVIDIPVHMDRVTGNRLTSYQSLIPIIKKAIRSGKHEIDIATASVAEFARFMRLMRRNPRKYLAAQGASDLSAIEDMSEPDSPTVIRQPNLKAESRSPQKRIARLMTNPFKSRTNRLAEGFVQLAPGPSRMLDSSPTKSASAPSSPTASSPPHSTSPVLPTMTRAGISSSPVSESAASAKENAFNGSVAFDSSPARPGRTFRLPSEFDSSSIADSTHGPPETPTKSSSPVNYSRPIAPTPSQWNRAEPSTPFTPKPQSAAPTTPGMTSSPIGLSALLPPSTPNVPQCTYNTPSGVDSIDFGKESPFRSNSISWMNNSVQDNEPKRIKNVNHARRRQSEPLLRKYFDTQARRRSASPKKVQYQDEDTFRDEVSIASLFDTPFATPAKVAVSKSTPIETTIAIEAIVTENATTENAITENAIIENATTENATTENAIIENATTENAITENAVTETIPAEDTALTVDAVEESSNDEDVSSLIEPEAIEEASELSNTEPVDVAMDVAAEETTVLEIAPAQAAASDATSTEVTVEQTLVDNEVSLMTEPEATQEVSDLPEPESTDVAMDVTAAETAVTDSEAVETTSADPTETSAIENGAHETSIDDNMELEPEAAPEVTDLADSTNPDSTVHETTAAESSVNSDYIIIAVDYSITENAAQPDADENMSDDLEDISEAPTVIIRTPTDTDMNETLPIPTDDENTELTTAEQGVVEIDVRENPDIFGAHVSSPPPAPIRKLSRMADNACSGHAKVVVNEQNGRLFVRFKLSAEYAHMFPASQGFDESQLTLTPSAISHSPRISFDSNRIHRQSDMSSPAKAQDTPIATRLPSLSEMLQTPDISAFGRSPSFTSEFRTPELPAHDNTLMFGSPAGGLTPAFKPFTPNTRSIDSLLQTHDMSAFGTTTKTPGDSFQTPELPPSDNTLMFGSTKPMSTKRVTRRQSAMTPLKQALTNATGTHRPATPKEPTAFNYNTPKFATPMNDAADRTLAFSWSDTKDSTTHDNDRATQIATPTKLTHTEVQPATEEPITEEPTTTTSPTTEEPTIDQPTIEASTTTEQPAIEESTTETLTTSDDQPIELSNAPEQPIPNIEVAPAQEAPAADDSRQDLDSPGREYMRNFIKRSRQAATTTDAGSPIAPINQRQPLGARSPNRGSPMKTKRKHEEDHETDVQSPPKKIKVEEVTETASKSAPKKGRRTKNSRQKSELEIDMTDLPAATPTTSSSTTDKQVDELDAVTPATRRSSRLRVQETASGAPKSSLPTPIKLNRAGAGRNGGANLTKKPRTEDQELDRKTRSNTKKNMGDAEFPSEVLVRLAGQVEEDSDVSQESEGSAGGRRVGWKTPLEKVQGETPKKGRAAPKGKGKATQGETGISKPKSTSKSTPKTARATKVAEGLGMVANGTPVKPQRVTRSRARSGV
ncbi:hypothetical protein HG530_007706 [Fusarium avenaceum]|nr:hypothetical protein HG530_007706 [Fusarium avenaceum]